MSLEMGFYEGITPLNSDGAGDATAEGQVRMRFDANGRAYKEIYLRNFSANPSVSGQCYIYATRGQAGSGQVAIDPAAVASVNRSLVVPSSVIPVNQFGWYTYWGVTSVAVSGTNVLAGDFLKLAPGTQASFLLRDGGVGTQSTSSLAMARANQTAAGAVTTEVFLFGDAAVINV